MSEAAAPERTADTRSSKNLVVHWKWGPTTKFAGGTFWAVHATDVDGRILDWPKEDLIPLGASEVMVIDGEGLDLLRPIAEQTEALNKERGWDVDRAPRKAR
jgi:hypothetical protein